jgi:hypothetical protein
MIALPSASSDAIIHQISGAGMADLQGILLAAQTGADAVAGLAAHGSLPAPNPMRRSALRETRRPRQRR